VDKLRPPRELGRAGGGDQAVQFFESLFANRTSRCRKLRVATTAPHPGANAPVTADLPYPSDVRHFIPLPRVKSRAQRIGAPLSRITVPQRVGRRGGKSFQTV